MTTTSFVESENPYFCELCGKHLVDAETAICHAASEKHKRQLRYIEESGSVSSGSSIMIGDYDIFLQNVIARNTIASCIGRCLLCRVSLNDVYQALSHICSRRHRQNLDWYQRVHAAKAIGKFISAMEADPRNNDIPFENDLYDRIDAPPDFIISSDVWSLIRELPEGVVVREWEYFCVFCGCKCLSDEFMYQHSRSHGHNAIRGLKQIERGGSRRTLGIRFGYSDTDWESAVSSGEIPSPPLNRRPVQA